MPHEHTDDDTPDVDTPEPAGSGDQTPDSSRLGESGMRALEAERRARGEAERKAREAEARIAELELAEARRDVAAAKGLTAEQARFLAGSTREELEAAADDLLKAFAPISRVPFTRGPRESLRGGTDPDAPVEPDPAVIADRIFHRSGF